MFAYFTGKIKVIVEKLPREPAKPQAIIEYPNRTINVNLVPSAPIEPKTSPRNVLTKWVLPEIIIAQKFDYLGVQFKDPIKYANRHKASLVESSQLPREVARFETPNGEFLASESHSKTVSPFRGAI